MLQEIHGRTLWTKEELTQDTSRWIYIFTNIEIHHMEQAIKDIEAKFLQLAEVDPSICPLPSDLVEDPSKVRDELINGISFTIIRGSPVHS
jgi:hypothetical protein